MILCTALIVIRTRRSIDCIATPPIVNGRLFVITPPEDYNIMRQEEAAAMKMMRSSYDEFCILISDVRPGANCMSSGLFCQWLWILCLILLWWCLFLLLLHLFSHGYRLSCHTIWKLISHGPIEATLAAVLGESGTSFVHWWSTREIVTEEFLPVRSTVDVVWRYSLYLSLTLPIEE